MGHIRDLRERVNVNMRNWEVNVADDLQMIFYRNLEDAILN